MARSKGIRLRRKLAKLFRRCIHRRTRRGTVAYQRLEPAAGPISKLWRWVQSFRREARSRICPGKTNPGCIEPGQNPVSPPKGHLAVYVGEKEGSVYRVVLPVLYFNHPLFGSLLREAEKVYGFDHPGGIQIPCPISELERVQMKIAAARSRRGLLDRRDSFLGKFHSLIGQCSTIDLL